MGLLKRERQELKEERPGVVQLRKGIRKRAAQAPKGVGCRTMCNEAEGGVARNLRRRARERARGDG